MENNLPPTVTLVNPSPNATVTPATTTCVTTKRTILGDIHFIIAYLGVCFMGFVTAFPDAMLEAWNMLPGDVKFHLPASFVSVVGLVMFSISVIARMVGHK